LNWKILQLPPVTTVASGRLRSARRALRTGAALGTDEPTSLGFLEPQQGQTYLGWQQILCAQFVGHGFVIR
jgi:hypothetical protein